MPKGVFQRITQRQEWMFFAALPKADGLLAFAWWVVVLLHGVLPALFAIAMGVLVAAVQRGESLAGPLMIVGVIFVLLQVLTPIQTAVSHNLGDRTAAFLYDRLTEACVRPQGMGHLEDPTLTGDLTVARDFDLGMTGPPLSYSMDFIAGGLVGMIGGLAAAIVLFGFCVVGAARARRRVARDALAAARERGLARSQHRRSAERPARRGLRVPPRRRSAGQQGAAAVRAGAAGRSSGSSPGARGFTSCSTTRHGCASGRSRGACCSSRPPTSSCSGRLRRRPRTAASTSARSSSTRSARLALR